MSGESGQQRPCPAPATARRAKPVSSGRGAWTGQPQVALASADSIRRLRLIHWKSGVSGKVIMTYALFFSRFRLPISAISIGPRLNSPASAFRVSSLR